MNQSAPQKDEESGPDIGKDRSHIAYNLTAREWGAQLMDLRKDIKKWEPYFLQLSEICMSHH